MNCSETPVYTPHRSDHAVHSACTSASTSPRCALLSLHILSETIAIKIETEKIAQSVQPTSPEVLSHVTCVSVDKWQVDTQGGVQLFEVKCNSLWGQLGDAQEREAHVIRLEKELKEKERLHWFLFANESAASQTAAECARIEVVRLDAQIGQTTPHKRDTKHSSESCC